MNSFQGHVLTDAAQKFINRRTHRMLVIVKRV